MEGKIHSVETMGTVDGPGLRFVLFLQGCSLKCKYCHNRDTWNMEEGETRTVKSIIKQIKRYKNYIVPEGGVTVTGGEPLLQVKFLIELFTELKKEQIHTCIDTSGMVTITQEVKDLLKLTDLVLLDIKHIDDKKCIELVGVSNKKELEFAKYLSDNQIKMWIRQVVVPGFTDDEKDIIRLREFVNGLKSVEKIEFLPYHKMGKYKWEKLNEIYELEGVPEATQKDIERVKKIYFEKLSSF